jgi:spore maturation protein CgeB
VRNAHAVVVGSFVPDGASVLDWTLEVARGQRCFYDIDTPVTLAKLARGEEEYLRRRQIAELDHYLSFTGGPILLQLERELGAKHAVHLACSADPDRYRPMSAVPLWSMGYLGTYSLDRQPTLERLLIERARRDRSNRFVVAGPQYPEEIEWPENVDRIEHLAPDEHAAFYCAQCFTLNVTRLDMVKAGWSPSVRLFEAAACAVPIVTDPWDGLSDYFEPRSEIIVADEGIDLDAISETERRRIGERARARVLAQHTGRHRALQVERLLKGEAA